MPGIYLATEDDLSTSVAKKLVSDAGSEFTIYGVLCQGGYGYLKSNLDKFSALSRNIPVLLITDLDRKACAPSLIEDWSNGRRLPENLLFRVCIREVESWLLADHEGIKSLLGGRIGKLPSSPDTLEDPKRELLRLATKAPRKIKGQLISSNDSVSSQGLGYNSVLSDFVNSTWNLESASERSDSLRRARSALAKLKVRLRE